MKKFFYAVNLIISLLFVISCQDEKLIEMQPSSHHTLQTRSVTPENFDWEHADWMPTPPGQTRIPSPWVGQGSLASTYGTDVIEDRLKSDGWELLYSTFTTNVSGPLQNPYFVLYNKYRGLMRIFLYTTTQFISPSSYIEDCLSINSNHNTRLFDFLASEISIPGVTSVNRIKQIQPKPFDGSLPLASNKWYMMQYELAYDPDIVEIPYNQIQLVWNLNFYDVENISMGGDLQAEINGTIGNTGKDWKSDAKDATKKVGTGLLSGVGVSLWERTKKGTDGSNKLGLNKSVFNKIGEGLKSAVSAATHGVFGDIVNVFSAIIGPQSISPVPINMNVSGNVTLKGTLSSSGSLPSMPISFWMPGTNIPSSAVGYIPLYNKPLGVINFSDCPKFPISYHETSRLYNDDSLPGDGLVQEFYEAATVHTEGDFSNYLIINPEIEKIANVDIVSQQILKKSGDNYVTPVQVYENISYSNPYLAYAGKTEIVDMDFVVKFIITVTPKKGGNTYCIIKTLDLKEEWE